MTALADRFASVGGRVAIVREYAEAMIETRGKIVQLGKLVLRERLGREEIQCAGIRVFKDSV